MKTPFDDIVEKLDSYIKDPAKVTRETLKEFKSSLLEIREVMDEDYKEDDDEDEDKTKNQSLVIMIGKAAKKGDMKK